MEYLPENILTIDNRADFRLWLSRHARTEKECWLVLKRGRPRDDGQFWYLDAVEEALCFGWIDSTLGLVDGVRMQRFTPRGKNSSWTELNKERVRRLERLGLMTDAGRAVLPDMSFTIHPDIEEAIRAGGVWEIFASFPPLYKRVRASNLAAAKKRSATEYRKALAHFLEQTRAGKLYGEWNDYGRLTES